MRTVDRRTRRTTIHVLLVILAVALVLVLGGCGSGSEEKAEEQVQTQAATEATVETTTEATTQKQESAEPDAELFASGADIEIPEYDGEASVKINGNQPMFADALKTTDSREEYGKLDKRGRCTGAFANLSVDTQPAPSEERQDISSVHPSGWRSGMGWERCHLIGWQLCGENANEKNLVTGTHYMNVDGMLPYENEVHTYIEETGNHVLYLVEPVFKGKNMVCSGVHMQAESVEDDGEGVSFNVFCFNVSPGNEIDYKTGAVTVTDEAVAEQNAFERTYVLNTNTMKFHYPSCDSVARMSDHNKETVTAKRGDLIKQGYDPCGMCEP